MYGEERDRYLSDRDAKEQILEVGRRMYAKNYVVSNDGNITCKVSPTTLWTTPTGVSKGYMTDEMLIKVDLEGHVLQGTRKPSSEWALHTLFYKRKPHIRAVVHTHSMYCTTFAVLGRPLQAVHYAIADAGAAEIPCAPYHPFGTLELAEAAVKTAGDSDAVLLGNHGLVACGRDLVGAFSLARNLEYVAELQYRALCIGTPNVLSAEQMADVMVRFQSYGQPDGKKTGY